MGIVDKILRRPVVDLAQAVDDALTRLAEARGLEAIAQETLLLAQRDVREAQQAVATARDALFTEHPELGMATAVAAVPVVAETGYEQVEVDDENDPRFTGGVEISPDEDVPLPPIEWEERDG